MKLTEDQKQDYIKNDYGSCPICKSDNIDVYGDIEADGNLIWQRVRCDNCKFEWTDIYMLVHSTGKETHWYFMEAIGNNTFRESQHFTSREDAERIPRHQLVWTKNNGENACEACKEG